MKYAKINKLEYSQFTDEDYNIPYAHVSIEIALTLPEDPNGGEDLHLFDFIKAGFDSLSDETTRAMDAKSRKIIEIVNNDNAMFKGEEGLVYTFCEHVSDTAPIRGIIEELKTLKEGGELNYRTIDETILSNHIRTLYYYWD